MKNPSCNVKSLNYIRNVSAHHSRLWNINILERAHPLQNDNFWCLLDNAKPFFYFCLIKKLMDVVCPTSKWGERFCYLLEKEFPKNEHLSLDDFGVIKGWESWELWS